MSEYIVDTFGIVQDFADLHGDMSTPLYRAIMNVMLSRQHEEIVRCRDCKFYSQEQPTEISGIFKVKHPAWCHKHIAKTKPNGFCAWAKRKEGGDE